VEFGDTGMEPTLTPVSPLPSGEKSLLKPGVGRSAGSIHPNSMPPAGEPAAPGTPCAPVGPGGPGGPAGPGLDFAFFRFFFDDSAGPPASALRALTWRSRVAILS
jgi:hypothetical protein